MNYNLLLLIISLEEEDNALMFSPSDHSTRTFSPRETGSQKLLVLVGRVNVEINKIDVWFKANKMATNIGKTKYIIFRSKNKKIKLNEMNVFYDANDLDVEPNPDLITPL